MRFSVNRHSVCAGEKKRTLRKSAFCEAGVTEKRILRVPSRKSALWEVGVTEKRTLGGRGHGKAQFAQALSPKSHSATHADHRVHLSVRSNVQTAPFREGADSECGFP